MQTFQSWQAGWLAGAVVVFIALVLSFFVVNKPRDRGQHPDGLNPEEALALAEKNRHKAHTYRTAQTWTLKEILKTKAFWLIAMIGLTQSMPVIFIMVHGVFHFTDHGFSKMQAASVISFILLGSGLSRFPMGLLGDRIEPRWICATLLGVMAAAYLGIWLAPNLVLLMIAGPVFGFTYGTILVLMPTLYGNYFGPTNYPGIMAIFAPAMTVFVASVPMGAGYINDLTGNYNLAFTIIILLILAGIASALLAKPPVKK